MATLYRICSRLFKGDLRAFDEECGAHWDTAVAGSSALQAAIGRMAVDEVARHMGLEVATMFWDFTKYYDHIRACSLMRRAVRLGYPAKLLQMGLLAHHGNRHIRVNGWFSRAVVPNRSIVAGDVQANTLAKLALYYIMEELHRKVPRDEYAEERLRRCNTKSWQFVDDVVQRTEGRSKGQVRDKAIEQAVKFARLAKREGFAISDKSVIASTCKETAVKMQKALKEEGVECRIVSEAKDVGINNTLAKKRGKTEHEVRMAKGKKRGEKVRWM